MQVIATIEGFNEIERAQSFGEVERTQPFGNFSITSLVTPPFYRQGGPVVAFRHPTREAAAGAEATARMAEHVAMRTGRKAEHLLSQVKKLDKQIQAGMAPRATATKRMDLAKQAIALFRKRAEAAQVATSTATRARLLRALGKAKTRAQAAPLQEAVRRVDAHQKMARRKLFKISAAVARMTIPAVGSVARAVEQAETAINRTAAEAEAAVTHVMDVADKLAAEARAAVTSVAPAEAKPDAGEGPTGSAPTSIVAKVAVVGAGVAALWLLL